MTSRSWRDVRKDAEHAGLVDDKLVDTHRAQLEADTRAHRLAEIRKARHVTQNMLATEIGVTQSRVSRLEAGELDRVGIDTVKAYVEALGGQLEIVATFGDERIRVR